MIRNAPYIAEAPQSELDLNTDLRYYDLLPPKLKRYIQHLPAKVEAYEMYLALSHGLTVDEIISGCERNLQTYFPNYTPI